MARRSGRVLRGTDFQLKLRTELRRLAAIPGAYVAVGLAAGHRQQAAGDVGVVGGIVSHFGNGAFPQVEVPGEAGVSCKLRLSRPELVVTNRIAVGSGEPLVISERLGLPGGRLVEIHDHRCEKRGLRACEVVGSIRVKDGAVVLDLEEK